MATLNLSFDTGAVPLSEIQDAFADRYGWTATISGGNGTQIPNPESKAQFTRRIIKQIIQNVHFVWKKETTEKAASAGITEITLT